jgi:hypothetical protein
MPGRGLQPTRQVDSVQASSTIDITQDVTVDTRDHLVELYLRHVHDKPHTLCHHGSLREQVKDGTFPKTLIWDKLCLDNIYASILIGNTCGADGESLSEGLYFRPGLEQTNAG